MQLERPFGRLPWIVVTAMVLLPACAVMTEVLKGGFSDWNMTTGGLVHFPTIHSYLSAIGSGRTQILAEQIGRAFIVATIDILIAVPAAHFLVRRVPQMRRMIIIVVLLLPFFVNSATKAFAWKIILGSHGPIVSLLTACGFTDKILLYNPWAVIISLVSSSLPLALFAVTGFMSAIPPTIWNLCDDMGLDSGNELLFVALPVASKGATVGWIASFVVCALASHEIDFTGGVHQMSLTRAVDGLFNRRDPNAAMAMGVIFLFVIAAAIYVGRVLLRSTRRLRFSKPLPFRKSGLVIEKICLGLAFLIILAPAVSILAQTTGMVMETRSEAREGLSTLVDEPVTLAFEHTSAVAIFVTIPAVLGAVVTALSWWNAKSFQAIVVGTLCLAAVPGNSYAMGVFFLMRGLHLSVPPVLLVVLSQIAWVFPFILLTVASGYARIPASALEAARDLGASPIRVFALIIFPLCWPEIILSGVVGIVLSSNDASRASLLSNRYQVMSEYIAGRLGSGNDISDYFLASLSVFLGVAVIVGFLICIFYSNKQKESSLEVPEQIVRLGEVAV